MLREDLLGTPRCYSCSLSKTASHNISEQLFSFALLLSFLFNLWSTCFSGWAAAILSSPNFSHAGSCDNVVEVFSCKLISARPSIALWCRLRSFLAALCLWRVCLQQLSVSLFLRLTLVSQPHLLRTLRYIMLTFWFLNLAFHFLPLLLVSGVHLFQDLSFCIDRLLPHKRCLCSRKLVGCLAWDAKY